ncbi:cobalamin-binding protein [Thalassolituus sp. LLYu03]|uniref:cobalamin-binding protein n=1 Tax=Thalassolituus sp. LLYu03 TaxID=3421656 RepID=UPI003D282A59
MTLVRNTVAGISRTLLMLAGLLSGGLIQAEVVATGAIDITDDLGVRHQLAQPAQRIVALMPHGTELLFEVGAGAQVVGTVDYSDYPLAAKQIPRVGGYSGLNIEAIVALNPDLVVAWPEGNKTRELERLRQLGLPLFASDPRTFDGIANSLERLGIVSGHAAEGKQRADEVRSRTQALRDTYSHQAPLTVFYQVWHEPLLTQNGSTFISHAIELCGGHNIFADLPLTAPQVSIEAVLAADPQVIVASGMGASRPEWLDEWRKYPGLTAVATNSLYHIHPDFFNRPTSRFLTGTEQLCAAMAGTRQRAASTR